MATKKVGELVKEARTAAKLTQEKLASQAGEGLTATDIGKCERGTADLTTAQLKRIAVVCGVTQTSLVNAPKNLSGTTKKTTTAKSTSTAKTTTSTAKKTTTKSTTPAGANTSMKVTATEKKLIEAYRTASSDEKKIALKVVKGEYGDKVESLLGLVGGTSSTSSSSSRLDFSDTISNFLTGLLGGK